MPFQNSRHGSFIIGTTLLFAIGLLPGSAFAQRGGRGAGGPQVAQPVGDPRFDTSAP